jgi:hypothetical protein
VEKLGAEFRDAKERTKTLTGYQEVLGLVADEYESLEDVEAIATLQVGLWQASRDFGKLTASWKDTPLGEVQSDELEKVVQTYNKTAYRCSKGLMGNPVVDRLKAQVSAACGCDCGDWWVSVGGGGGGGGRKNIITVSYTPSL